MKRIYCDICKCEIYIAEDEETNYYKLILNKISFGNSSITFNTFDLCSHCAKKLENCIEKNPALVLQMFDKLIKFCDKSK